LSNFADFYSSKGLLVPWSNTNAGFADAYVSYNCKTGTGQTSVPGSSISTNPNYGITSILDQVVETHNIGQAAAIDKIKNQLNQNKAIWMAFFVANAQDGNAFQTDFWRNLPETAVWNPDPYNGHIWDPNTGWGHAVLVVGYDDTNPNNRYWVILNSWDTTLTALNRPNGLFRMKMDINYDGRLPGLNTVRGSDFALYFETLDVQFSGGNVVTTVDRKVDLNAHGLKFKS
jgi:hypothetical protein